MATPLELINRVRAADGRSPLLFLRMDEDCVLEAALELPIGWAEHPAWRGQEHWVVRLPDAYTARLVGYALDQPWQAHEVRLPDSLIDLAVSQHFDVVIADQAGVVRGWWIPDEDGLPLFVTPHGS